MKYGRIIVPSNVTDALAAGDVYYYQGAKTATYDGYTKLLAHFNGTTGDKPTPDTTGKTLTYNGTAAVSTATTEPLTNPPDTAALLLDGNSDWVSLASSSDWAFGTADHTIDCWVNFVNLSGIQQVFAYYGVTNGQPYSFRWEGSENNFWRLVLNSASATTFADATMSTNTWYHIAVVKYSGSYYFYRGGTQIGASYADSYNIPAEAMTIGALDSTSGGGSVLRYFNGYIDEFRVSKGIARWTASFSGSLPTTEYPYSGGVGGLSDTLYPGWQRVAIGTTGQKLQSTLDAKNNVLYPKWAA